MSDPVVKAIAEANALLTPEVRRRVRAALAATSAFSTAGLEQIAQGGYGERLALLASLMMDEVKAKAERPTLPDVASFEGVKKLLGYDKPSKEEDDEQGERYQLSRGD